MQVRLLKWEYEGVRGVNDLVIDLERETDKPYPNTLIMMPNGTGKTTTITLLRAIFHGGADQWNPGFVRGFMPVDSDVQKGEFRATLLIDNNIYIVYLILDYRAGKAKYMTSRVGDEGGLVHGHKLPAQINDIFTSEFVDRFVFDAELAKDIIDSKSDEAEKAITYLYQLNRLDEMIQRINSIVTNAQQKAEKTAAKTSQGLNRLRTERDRLANLLKELTAKQKKLTTDFEEKSARYNEIKANIEAHIKADENLRAKVDELQSERNLVKLQILEKGQSVLNSVRSPYLVSKQIANRLETLSNKMQQLKLPKTMSREFFEELAVQSHCVCGREIGEDQKESILQRSTDYLAEDQIGVINAIKSAIRDHEYNNSLKDDVDTLKTFIDERGRIERDWDRLQSTRRESGDIELEEMESESDELVPEITRLKDNLRWISTKDKSELANLDYTENIHLCNEELRKAEEKFAEATDTVKLVQRAAKAKRYLRDVKRESLIRLKEKIKKQTNDKISKIILRDRIYIEGIDGHLVLKGKTGASVGQTLAIAYSFLGSMFESSAHQLPFVVDSPAGALDLEVRRHVSAILPELFEQLIIFITSGERDGFAEHFYGLGNDVKFLTIFRDTDQSVHCHEGENAFKRFQEDMVTL